LEDFYPHLSILGHGCRCLGGIALEYLEIGQDDD